MSSLKGILRAFFCAAAIGLAISTHASAAVMINPGSVFSSSYSRGGETSFNAVANLTNQFGLSKTYTSGVTTLSNYLSAPAPTHLASYSSNEVWLASPNGGATWTTGLNIVFDLGSEQWIGGALLWEITASGHGGRTPKHMQFDISNDPTFATYSIMGTPTLAGVDPVTAMPAHQFDFTSPASGRYVRFTVNDTFSTENITQLAELTLYTPEPASLGFLGLGSFVLIRRSRKVNN